MNLLMSLAWPNHVHHRPARAWFGRRRGSWATTPVTESGFVRVSSNGAAIPTAVRPGEALALLGRLREARRHVFLPDDVQLVVADYVAPELIVTHRDVTDAHLLALSRRHGARLATFDRGVLRLAGDAGDVVLVPG
ncbi:MAG: TA system VapC family ribonuclease toxin [Acidimicrobiales bacterium]